MTDSLAAEMAEAIASRPVDRRAAATAKAVGMYRLMLVRELHGATEATIEAAVEDFRADVVRRVAGLLAQPK
jgi:hypothetical protein